MAASASATLTSAVPTAPTQRTDATNRSVNGGHSTTLNLLESQTDQLLLRISPTEASAAHREGITNFVQKLVKRCYQQYGEIDVYVFGSVALKAYLPDGDIDFSLFPRNGTRLKDTWATRLYAALQRQQNKPPSNGYSVSNPQIINAEVKLVKFLVEDVVVDISFETLSGLSTVNFLQDIDLHIGGNQLFKRSIILCKAWCYYESRLLGAQHGLLSSYALEILVLHILNVHHATARTPLQVLHRFLQVYSTMDWEAQCLTLSGPVPICSVQGKTVAEAAVPPAPEGAKLDDTYLEELLDNSKPMQESGPEVFVPKFLNIQDPMLATNNLGRSVSKANAARIVAAWSHAAGQLSSILQQNDPETALSSLAHFFQNISRLRPTLPRPLSVPQLQQLQLSALGTAQPLQLSSGQHVMEMHQRRLPPNAQQRSQAQASRQQRQSGLPDTQLLSSELQQQGQQQGGWPAGCMPSEPQRMQGGNTASVPNLRRGLPSKDGNSRSALHQRLPSHGGERNVGRSKSSQCASLTSTAGNVLDSVRSNPRAAASLPGTQAMFRSYSVDTGFSTAQQQLLSSSSGKPLNGCLDSVHLNGFAPHASEARVQLAPEQQAQLHQQLQAHFLQQRRQRQSQELSTGCEPVDAAAAGTSNGRQSDAKTQGHQQGPRPSGQMPLATHSVPSSPARERHTSSRAAAHRQPPIPLEQSVRGQDQRLQNPGSVRSHSSGSIGRPLVGDIPGRPMLVLPPPSGWSGGQPPPPPPPPPIDDPAQPQASLHQANESSASAPPQASQPPQMLKVPFTDAAPRAASQAPSQQALSQRDLRQSLVAAAQAAAQRALQSPAPAGSVHSRSEPRAPAQSAAKEQADSRAAASRAMSPPNEGQRGDLFPAAQPLRPQQPPVAPCSAASAATVCEDGPQQQQHAAIAAPELAVARSDSRSSREAGHGHDAIASLPVHSMPLAASRQWPAVSSAPPSVADFDGHPGSPPSVLPIHGPAPQFQGVSPPRQLHVSARRSTAASEGSAASRSPDSTSGFPAAFGSPGARCVGAAPQQQPASAGRLAPLTTAEYPPLQANGIRWPPSLQRSSAPAASHSSPLTNGHPPTESAAHERPQRVSYKAAMAAIRSAGRVQSARSSRDDVRLPGPPPAPPSSVGSMSQAGGDTPRSAASAPGGASGPSLSGSHSLASGFESGARVHLGSANSRSGSTQSAGASPRGRLPQYPLHQALPLAAGAVAAQQARQTRAANESAPPSSNFALMNDDFPALAAQQPSGKRGNRKGDKAAAH